MAKIWSILFIADDVVSVAARIIILPPPQGQRIVVERRKNTHEVAATNSLSVICIALSAEALLFT